MIARGNVLLMPLLPLLFIEVMLVESKYLLKVCLKNHLMVCIAFRG